MFGDQYFFVHLLVMLPGLLLSLWATFYTRSTFAKYSQVPSRQGITGAEAAATMLARNNVRDVAIERTPGTLTDHYDPTTKTLRLSESVYDSTSLAAIGVACHEAGHALQHATGYAALGLRTAMVPAVTIGTNAAYVLLFIGFLFSPKMILWGAILFSVAVLFTLVTLPVEWNASARAKVAMRSSGVITQAETDDAAQVLNAAFLTYVAAAVTALLELLYYLWRAGLFGGRRDD